MNTTTSGRSFIGFLKTVQRRWFPSRAQKDFREREQQAFAARTAFYGSFLRSNDLCFDIGANRGNRIAPMLEAGARVVAVEPQEDCANHLEHTFGNRITLIRKGLGAEEGVQNFYISSSHTLSSFSSEWITEVKKDRFREESWDRVVEMEITTLDKLIEQYGEPAFIKIDVEGYETEVLKGLHHTIGMISFEYTVPEQTNNALSCIDLIAGHSPNTECNYSIGESMEWALPNWLSPEDMKQHVRSGTFSATGFGDIYLRRVSGTVPVR